ncbi:MAG: hypothetical protein CMH58_01350 [Myxococcales bacterium]|nr:hypothetical protein [Myxococcales bacterium]
MRLLLVMTALSLATPAAAWQAQIGKWSLDGSPNIAYQVNTRGAPGIAGDSDLQAIRNSFDSWSGVSCSTINLVESGTTNNLPNARRDNVNNVWFETRANAWSYGAGTLGITGTSFSGFGCRGNGRPARDCWIVDADVQFNAVQHADGWSTNGRGGLDVESISVHEIGHSLGLDHPCENCTVDAVMTPSYVGYPFRYPRQDDTNAVCSLYPGQRGGLGWGCNRDSDCNSRICLDDGSNDYCTVTCGNCPDGYECRADNGRNVCQRAAAGSGAAQQGESCAGGRACGPGLLCLGDQNDATCYAECDRGNCEAGFICETFSSNGQNISICLPGGTTAEGESCDSLYACEAGLECAPVGGRYVCARGCRSDNDCNEREDCQELTRPGIDTVQVCVESNTALEGENCQRKRCADGLTCLSDAGERTCFRNCRSRADCSAGLDCIEISDTISICYANNCTEDRDCERGKICLEGSCVDETGGCRADTECRRGEICQNGECTPFQSNGDLPDNERCADDGDCVSNRCAAIGSTRICRPGCDRRLGHFECPEGFGCIPDDEGNGYCERGADEGGQSVGSPCSSAIECRQGICGSEWGFGGECLTWCGENFICPAGYLCDSANNPMPGLCVPEGGGVATGYACACDSTTPDAWLLGFGLLALMGWRRRRSA